MKNNELMTANPILHIAILVSRKAGQALRW
jgi:hypothetical protein